MNIMERLNDAVDYIELHLTDNIDLAKLARITGLSAYNFQRMFSCIAELSVVDYIRRRRLTMAALELQDEGVRVIDIAVKYGYESPVSFARAFKQMHQITPSEARGKNVTFCAYSRISFQIIVTGVSAMNYRIVKTEAIQVFGVEGLISTIGEKGYYENAGQIWQANHQNGRYEKLFQAIGGDRHQAYPQMFVRDDMCRIHGLMNYKKRNDTTYGYMQCGLVTPESSTDGYAVFNVPAATWAVFPFALEQWDMEKAVRAFHKRFYSEWLPVSGYEKADASEFEMYGGTPDNGYLEFWMPVFKKHEQISK